MDEHEITRRVALALGIGGIAAGLNTDAEAKQGPMRVLRRTIGNDPIVSVPSETNRSYGDFTFDVRNSSNGARTYTARLGVIVKVGGAYQLITTGIPGIKDFAPPAQSVAKGTSHTFTVEVKATAEDAKGVFALLVVVSGGSLGESVDVIRFNND